MKNYLAVGVLVVLLVAVAMSVSAEENAKIKLPDGMYMYDSSISKREDGSEWVGFRTFFVVQNNIIYSAQGALRKFGVSKFNKLFSENKKYKILLGGEKIGEIYNVKIGIFNNEVDWNYKQELLVKNIKQGPAYGRESIYLGRLGSAAKCLAVPEKYKEVKKKVYTTISQEEVDKITKLAKEKLLPLLINRREVKKYQIEDLQLASEELELLDKYTYRNDDLYIGIYRFGFENIKGGGRQYYVLFSVRADSVHIITSQYDNETLFDTEMKIYGMLDFDGCGMEELFIDKIYTEEDNGWLIREIYKQNSDGSWSLIIKSKR